MDCVEELRIYQDAIINILFDNDMLYVGETNGHITLLKDHKILYSFDAKIMDHKSIACGDGVLYTNNYEHIDVWKDGLHINTVQTSSYISSLVYGDGILYSGDDSGTIKMWKDNEYISTIKAHNASVISLVYDNKTLYSHGDDGLIKSYKDGVLTILIEKEQDEIISIAYGDGMMYCAGEEDGIEVWRNGEYITKLDEDKPLVCLAYNNGMLYSGHTDGTIKVWKEVGLHTKAALK